MSFKDLKLKEQLEQLIEERDYLKSFLYDPEYLKDMSDREEWINTLKKELVFLNQYINQKSELYELASRKMSSPFTPNRGEQLIGSFNYTDSDKVVEIKTLASALSESIYQNVFDRDGRRASAGLTQIELGTAMVIKGLFS